MTKRAVAVSYNWETQEVLFTPFEGEEAGIQAMNWVHQDSFIWRDFLASEGWTHFFACNPEAAKEKGEILTRQMFGEEIILGHERT